MPLAYTEGHLESIHMKLTITFIVEMVMRTSLAIFLTTPNPSASGSNTSQTAGPETLCFS